MKFPLLATLLLLLPAVRAHRPLTTRPSCGTDFSSSATALSIVDPTISWAFQHSTNCSSRTLWLSFESPTPDFQFYVGVGVPTLERYADVRANALIIGPGLPAVNETVWNSLSEDIRNDPVWEQDSTTTSSSIGAYYHESPADQTTCNHMGTVMRGETSVVNDKCNFFEPFSQTNSWRVLDADNNNIPVQNATYHVAVFLQQDSSAKFGVAVGTWVEDFRTPYEIAEPACEQDLSDFYEKEALQEECFPVVSCDALDIAEGESIGCSIADATTEVANVCELGRVCDAETLNDACVVANVTYTDVAPAMSMMGSCGGARCPAAVQAWEGVNMRMHQGMMDLKYTGNAAVDFARGMIPHHLGAVDMCRILLEDLTCTELSDIDNLQGLVHFCSHVEYEQEIEVGGLRRWLEAQGLDETAPCDDAVTEVVRSSNTEMSMENGMMMMSMPESCGLVDAPSSAAFIELNHKMHKYMAIEYSCDHAVDFVRMMIPHHASAIEMCDILLGTEEGDDEYLVELCGNITLTQRAEIAWMYDWLDSRDLAISAPCGDCDLPTIMEEPCEDLLSTSSFCHGLGFGQDGYCKCEDTLTTQFSCDEVSYVDGLGVFVPSEFCKRTCGLCPEEPRPIWPGGCESGSSHADHGDDMNMNGGGDSNGGLAIDESGAPSSSFAAVMLFASLVLFLF